MKQSIASQESGKSFQEVAVTGAKIVGGVALASAAVYLTYTAAVAIDTEIAKLYIEHNGGLRPNVGEQLGVNNGSAQFDQDLHSGVVSLEIPAIDIAHTRGDK